MKLIGGTVLCRFKLVRYHNDWLQVKSFHLAAAFWSITIILQYRPGPADREIHHFNIHYNLFVYSNCKNMNSN
jgi:hypothetical protein